MGMQVTTINNQLCVELDTGSIFSDYLDYIPSFNDTLAKTQYNLANELYSKTTVQSTLGNPLTYSKGDSILAF